MGNISGIYMWLKIIHMCMHDSALDIVRELINGAIKDVDDANTNYKLRIASQLVDAIEHHEEDLSETLSDADLANDVESDLREMGYID